MAPTAADVKGGMAPSSQTTSRRRMTEDEEIEIRMAFDAFAALAAPSTASSPDAGRGSRGVLVEGQGEEAALPYGELKAAMRALGFAVRKAEVLAILDQYAEVAGVAGASQRGLSFAEFREVLAEKVLVERSAEDAHRRAFRLFDKSRSGAITVRDLRMVCRQIGVVLDDDELHDLIGEFDLDGDGAIDEREFLAIVAEVTG